MEELEFKTLEELLQYIASVGQEELTKIEDKASDYSESDGSEYGWGAKASDPIIIEGSLPYNLEERPNESGASSLVVTNKVNVGPEDFKDGITDENLVSYDNDGPNIESSWMNKAYPVASNATSNYNVGTSFMPYIPGSCGSTIYAHSTMPREVTITLKRNGIPTNREYLKKVAKLLELLDGTNWEVVDYFVDGNTNRD